MDDLTCRLYLITPEKIDDHPSFLKALEEAFKGGDIACLQIRIKDASDDDIIALTKAVLPLAHAQETAVLVNDRADLAEKSGADGVHLGQSDGSVQDARSRLGHNASIGVTCHDSMHLAFEAGEAGADYVAFGAFYDSGTKQSDYRPAPDILSQWVEVTELPCVAIGGIGADNCAPLVAAGADFIAVSGAVWNHPDGPRAGVAALNAAIKEAAPAA